MNKKLLFVMLALSLLLATTTSAYASEITETGEGTVPVDLTVETPIFSVTVPTSLPITLTQYGDIQVSDTATIINGSAGPIKITNIVTNGINGWSTVDYDSFDTSAAKVNSRNVGLTLAVSGSSISTTGPNINNFIGPVVLTKGETVPLIYDAKLPSQKEAQSNILLVDVIFTFAWDD